MISTLFFLALHSSVSLDAMAVVPAVDKSEWQVSGDFFECKMQQKLGPMAHLSFVQKPTQALELVLEMDSAHLKLQDVQATLTPADWQPGQFAPAARFSPQELSPHSARFVDNIPVLLQQLQRGYWMVLELDLPGQELSVKIPNLKSEAALIEFQKCTAALFPLLWEQAREYQVRFSQGARQPTPDDLEYLKTLARYIQQDTSVQKVLLDGHSNDAGTSLANRVVSEERADEVAARLIDLGVPKKKIEIRAHGNRYPLAKGQSNSRVLVRLIRKAG